MMYSPGSLAEAMVDAATAGFGPTLGPILLLVAATVGLLALLRGVIALPDALPHALQASARGVDARGR
jgi:hypothetical protein